MSERMGSAVPGTRPSMGKLWFPPLAVAIVILLLSSTPGTYFPDHPDTLNNLAHLVEFALLSFFLARALYLSRRLTVTALLIWTAAVCVSFGALDEAHQFLIPERMFDVMDLLFDTLGTVLGSLSFILLRTLKADHISSGPVTTRESDG